jgi:hypothetical protein
MASWLAWMEAHEGLLWWSGAISLAVLLGSLVAIPWILVRLPADYFSAPRRIPFHLGGRRHVVRRVVVRVVKNAVGGVLMLAGLAMLVLPGQGLLTLLMGFMLLDFPGKFGMESRLARVPFVRRAINGIRTRMGHEPLRFPVAPERRDAGEREPRRKPSSRPPPTG